MAKIIPNRNEVMKKEKATTVAASDSANSFVECFICKDQYRHKEMFSESTYSLDIETKDRQDNVSVCKQCRDATIGNNGRVRQIPPDLGDIGHRDTRDKRRNYGYREYSISTMVDDGFGGYIGFAEDTLDYAMVTAKKLIRLCGHVVVYIEDGVTSWVPAHHDSYGERIEGMWVFETIDGIDAYSLRKGDSGITTKRLVPKDWGARW